MKKSIFLLLPLLLMVFLFGPSCNKAIDNVTTITSALNMQYDAYQIIKDNKNDPAKAGTLFTEYCMNNKEKLVESFNKLNTLIGNKKQLSTIELELFMKTVDKVKEFIVTPDIKKVMSNVMFLKNAKQGLDIMTSLKSPAK